VKATQQEVLADYAKNPGTVQAFCEQKGLTDYALLAIDMVKECFDLAGSPILDVDFNDETGEEFLSVEFAARGGMDAVLTGYQRLLSRWVQAVPWPQRLMVLFYYSFAK
jgi:hypothetical protein